MIRRHPPLVALGLSLGSCLLLMLSAQAKPRAAKPSAARSAKAVTATVAAKDTTPPHRVIVYYFHTTSRCVSCRKIEAYSREAIDGGFAGELKDGRLVWRMVNVQEQGNEHFLKDYQLFTKSLVLVEEVKGKQARWKNCSRVWELLADKEKFLKYVQDEVRGYLSGKT